VSRNGFMNILKENNNWNKQKHHKLLKKMNKKINCQIKPTKTLLAFLSVFVTLFCQVVNIKNSLEAIIEKTFIHSPKSSIVNGSGRFPCKSGVYEPNPSFLKLTIEHQKGRKKNKIQTLVKY
jgi:hypothetical protein